MSQLGSTQLTLTDLKEELEKKKIADKSEPTFIRYSGLKQRKRGTKQCKRGMT